MPYNPELDKLLCFLDGKITAYLMKHDDDNDGNIKLLQRCIQELWTRNDNEKKDGESKLNGASC